METTQRTSRDPADVERRVMAIWTEVLGASAADRTATFFELGGQSISAVRITARLEEEVGVIIDMGDLFEDPSLDVFLRDVLAKVEAS